jgi:hypothetical protein
MDCSNDNVEGSIMFMKHLKHYIVTSVSYVTSVSNVSNMVDKLCNNINSLELQKQKQIVSQIQARQ